jgi:hypothetical protein
MATREGFAEIDHYTAADLTIVTDYLRRGRDLYERHLARIRSRPGKPASRSGRDRGRSPDRARKEGWTLVF